MTSSTILTVTCLAVTVCVAVFMIISISLPQWYTASDFDDGVVYKTEIGLFKKCRGVAGNIQCLAFKGEFLEGV